MEYLPINLNIKGKHCLVVGGGNIALRKSKQLAKAGAVLTIVALDFDPDFLQLASSNDVKLITEKYQSDMLDKQLLVIAATDDIQVNQAVYDDAERKGVIANVVDQPELCRFIMPSVIDRSPLTIAISSSGTAPVLARMLREKIEWILPDNIGKFLSKIKEDRKLIASRYPDMNDRRAYWESFFEKTLGWSASDNLASSTPTELELNYNLDIVETDESPSEVSLISFDKDIDDLTVGNIKQLQKADEVYLSNNNYDKLENLIRRDAKLHFQEKVADIDIISEQYSATDKKARVVVITS